MARRCIGLLASLTLAKLPGASAVKQCPGSVEVAGVPGRVQAVATQVNSPGKPAGPVQNLGGNLIPEMWGRAYLAQECTDGTYNNSQYLAIPLLGKRLTYTTDVSMAGCGCNAAMYLVSMRQNAQVSGCEDYYCDANSVCGVACDEIDIQEANRYAFHSALHKAYDGGGLAAGYGGWATYAWDASEYGPGAKCIDTDRPFRVSAAFPTNGEGRLRAMEISLSQGGQPCTLSMEMKDYPADPGFERLSQALEGGMTPVVSYWESSDMLWLDGAGPGTGPCKEDTLLCGRGPQFYAFAVQGL